MDFDVERHLAAADRSVSSLERDGRPAHAVTLARGFATTVADLWDAATGRERIPRWFLPVSGDLELGGRWQLEGNAGGVVTACERLSHLALTWEFGGDTSWVEARFSEDPAGGARVAVTHTALHEAAGPQHTPQWDEYGPGAVGVGWESALLGLAMHVERPDGPKPDEAAFVASENGRAFIAGSSAGWERASIAAGTDPAAARAAARRTVAFYTGEPAAD